MAAESCRIFYKIVDLFEKVSGNLNLTAVLYRNLFNLFLYHCLTALRVYDNKLLLAGCLIFGSTRNLEAFVSEETMAAGASS